MWVMVSRKFFCLSLSLLCVSLAPAFVCSLPPLTLRHFAPVCSCHWYSLTRLRLAVVQEAVRVIFFVRLLDWSLHMMSGGF